MRAANEGRTVIEMFPKERVTGDFDALADALFGVGAAAAPAAKRGHPHLRAPEGTGPRLTPRRSTPGVAGLRPRPDARRQPGRLGPLPGPAVDLLDAAQVEAVDEDHARRATLDRPSPMYARASTTGTNISLERSRSRAGSVPGYR